MNTVTKGKKGEDCAAIFLLEHGYRIIDRNFRIRSGEIDIIAEKEEALVFVEVKTWDAYSQADMEYAINGGKMKKIINTAKYYLKRSNSLENRVLRFDLIFISHNFCEVTHIKNAFSEV